MEVFTAADLQRNSAEVQRAASREPVVITNHDAPRFVLMSIEEYGRLKGSKRLVARADCLPDTAIARIQALADLYPVEEVVLYGGDEAVELSGEIIRATDT